MHLSYSESKYILVSYNKYIVFFSDGFVYLFLNIKYIVKLDNVKDMKAPEHHSWSNILLESNHVPISAAKVTLLQAVSIPLYPLSTISINTGPIYENLTMCQFLLQKSLLQAVSIPLYPRSTISINTGIIY